MSGWHNKLENNRLCVRVSKVQVLVRVSVEFRKVKDAKARSTIELCLGKLETGKGTSKS